MVAKISSCASAGGIVAYNQNKVNKEEAKILSEQKMIYNQEGKIDFRSALNSFNLHNINNKNTEKPFIHISLNPHPDDKLTDEQLNQIGKEYMERLGYGEQPYIIYKHEDIDRHHIHIVSSRVDDNGKKIKDRFEKLRSKMITNNLEKKYGLIPSSKSKKVEPINFKKVDVSRGNIKGQISNIIKPISSVYHFQSFNDYRTLLAQYNIHVEEIKGECNNKKIEGLIYYAMDENGKKTTTPFKSSLFGKSVGYKAIQEKIEKNKILIKDQKLNKKSGQIIREVLGQSSNKESFVENLKQRNIDVIFRENDTGRLYGVTYIDHNNNCIFNGSKLGKDLSANAIAEWFENPQVRQQQTQDQSNDNDNIQENKDINYNSQKHTPSAGLFSMPEDGGDDPEEDKFRREMQRKRRQKGRKF